MRKFARELGTDVNIIPGSEKFGRVSEEDVKKFYQTWHKSKTAVKK